MIIGMILDNTFPPDPRVENECKALIEEGHEVHLFCLAFGKKKYEKITLHTIHIHRYHVPKHVRSLASLAHTFPVYRWILQPLIVDFLTKSKAEICHIHDMAIAKGAGNAAKKLGLSTILDLHENRPEIMKSYPHVTSFLGKILIYPSIWKKREAQAIRQAQKTIVVTKEARDYYIDALGIGKTKFVIVPNTVRKQFYTEYSLHKEIISRYKQHFVLLYIGDTGLRRGIGTMIKALKHIVPCIPEIKLVILGTSKDDAILKKLAQEESVSDFVDFEGWQNMSTFPSYISASAVGTCPIHQNIHHNTTYANKIFQYMAFGRPILVSDCDAQANIARDYDCGLVFTDREEKDFAEKVLILYRDKEQYAQYAQNAASAISQHLNWELISISLNNMYAELAGKK
ncbi:MAG: glycosyltransferase family 4 protein [Bacteroidia bacterium]